MNYNEIAATLQVRMLNLGAPEDITIAVGPRNGGDDYEWDAHPNIELDSDMRRKFIAEVVKLQRELANAETAEPEFDD